MGDGGGRIIDLIYVKAACHRWALGSRAPSLYGNSIMGRLISGIKSTLCPWCFNRRKFCGHCDSSGRIPMSLHSRNISHWKRCPLRCVRQPKGARFSGLYVSFGDVCYRCHGRGVIPVQDLKVNPALICSTKHVGGKSDIDPLSAMVDDLCQAWRCSDDTVWLNKVLEKEYCTNGTQEAKALKMRISYRFYKYRLHDAHAQVGHALQRNML